MTRWLWAVSSLVLVACSREVRTQPPVTPALEATLFITSELKGYLGPCGCSENMRGGIARAAHQVLEAKQGRPVLLFDTGNLLFRDLQLEGDAVVQQELKATTLARAFTLMGLTAGAVGPLDDARGAAFRSGLGLPTLTDDQLTTYPVVDPKGLLPSKTVAVISSANVDTLASLGAKARGGGASFIVGLFQGPFDAAIKASQREGLGLDLLVASRSKTELSGEDNRAVMSAVPVVQVQTKGRSLLRVDLFLRDGSQAQWLKSPMEQQRELEGLAERIELLRGQVNDPSMSEDLRPLRKAKLEEVMRRREALAAEPLPVPSASNAASLRFIPLETSFESLPEAVALVTAYDRSVGELNLAWAKEHGVDCPAPGAGQAGFSGNGECKGCHAEAFETWNASKHSRAYPTLVDQGKNHHLDCVGCHVTGWKEPGGVCRIDAVAGRENVGCESCHGPGSLHAADPTKANIVRASGATMCVGCHDRENSPQFALEKYLPQVLGPGHGGPPTVAVVDANTPSTDAGLPAPKAGPVKAGPAKKKPAR